jgi:hypothetical protein
VGRFADLQTIRNTGSGVLLIGQESKVAAAGGGRARGHACVGVVGGACVSNGLDKHSAIGARLKNVRKNFFSSRSGSTTALK